MTPRTGTAPGWFPDPSDPARLRKWDGVGWTDSWMAAPTGDVGAPRFTEPGWHVDPFPGGQVSQRLTPVVAAPSTSTLKLSARLVGA